MPSSTSLRKFGPYSYSQGQQGLELRIDRRGKTRPHLIVGAALLGLAAYMRTSASPGDPDIPPIALAAMGALILILGLRSRADKRRILITGSELIYGKEGGKPDQLWAIADVDSVQLLKPAPVGVPYPRRRAPEPWRVVIRNRNGELFGHTCRIFDEEAAREMAEHLASTLGVRAETGSG